MLLLILLICRTVDSECVLPARSRGRRTSNPLYGTMPNKTEERVGGRIDKAANRAEYYPGERTQERDDSEVGGILGFRIPRTPMIHVEVSSFLTMLL